MLRSRIVCCLFNTVIRVAGNEDLTGNVCYLYSRFYALQVFLFKNAFIACKSE